MIYSIIISFIFSCLYIYSEFGIITYVTEFKNILLNFCNSVYSQNQKRRYTEGCLLPFPKKGDISQAKNDRGITLTSIPATIYNLMLLNRIRPEIEIIIRKNQNGFRQNRSTTVQILTIRHIIEGVNQII